MSDTKITDAGLRHLTALPKISSLFLSGTNVTDAGASQLSLSLALLNLSHTEITDKTLEQLAKSKKLVYLNLDSTDVTDEGLLHLHKLNLTHISLTDTAVTNDGLLQFSEQIPLCTIEYTTRQGHHRTISGRGHRGSMNGVPILATET